MTPPRASDARRAQLADVAKTLGCGLLELLLLVLQVVTAPIWLPVVLVYMLGKDFRR